MKIYKYEFLLEKILECQAAEIDRWISHKAEMYEVFEIPKKEGTRKICGLKSDEDGKKFARMQKLLYKRFLDKIPVSIHAKGFIAGEDYQEFLKPHIGNQYFMRIDIKDFFGSFSERAIKRGLAEYIVDKKALGTVYELCTLEKKLPQGAVTSPVLSNILFKKADQRILKYCQKIDEDYMKENGNRKNHICRICYTRYADDMLFSSDFLDFGENMYFYHMISKILGDNGFEINRRKTVISKDEIALNGYVIENNLHLSRKKLQNLKRILYEFRDENTEQYLLDRNKFSNFPDTMRKLNALGLSDRNGKKSFSNVQELIYYLSGYRSWIISVLRIGDTSQRQVRNMQKAVRRIEMILEELHKLEV